MKDSPQAPNPYQTAAAQTQSNLATAAQQQDYNSANAATQNQYNIANAERQQQYNLGNAERQQQYNTTNAATQNQYNRTNAIDAQRASMVDQSNPYGSTKYAQTGTSADGTPTYGVNTSLTGVGQQLFDSGNALKLGQQGVASGLLNSGMGAFSGKPVDLSYNGTTAALDSLNRARLDPQWDQNTKHQEDTLFARGVRPGTGAYDDAMRVFNQGKNDAYNSANLADYGLSSQNKLAEYNSPLQTYSALVNGTAPPMPGQGNVAAPGANISNPNLANPNISNPNIANPNLANPNVAGTNIAGLINDNYKQESANANAYNGQLAGLFGTGLGVAAAPFTGGTSLLGAGAGAMGGLFGGSPEYGGGNYFNSAYGGSSQRPLNGLSASDYGPGY